MSGSETDGSGFDDGLDYYLDEILGYASRRQAWRKLQKASLLEIARCDFNFSDETIGLESIRPKWKSFEGTFVERTKKNAERSQNQNMGSRDNDNAEKKYDSEDSDDEEDEDSDERDWKEYDSDTYEFTPLSDEAFSRLSRPKQQYILKKKAILDALSDSDKDEEVYDASVMGMRLSYKDYEKRVIKELKNVRYPKIAGDFDDKTQNLSWIPPANRLHFAPPQLNGNDPKSGQESEDHPLPEPYSSNYFDMTCDAFGIHVTGGAGPTSEQSVRFARLRRAMPYPEKEPTDSKSQIMTALFDSRVSLEDIEHALAVSRHPKRPLLTMAAIVQARAEISMTDLFMAKALSVGGDVNAVGKEGDDKYIAFARYEETDICLEYLELDYETDQLKQINNRRRVSWTPLHWACYQMSPTRVALLLAHGADPMAVAAIDGDTPASILYNDAERPKYSTVGMGKARQEIQRLLEEAGVPRSDFCKRVTRKR